MRTVRMHRVAAVAFAALAVGALDTLGTPPGARAQDRALDTLAGTWELVEPARQKRAVRAEVDRVIDQMSFLVRGIARDRAHREIRASPRVGVQLLEGERVALRFGGRPQTCRMDGRPRRGEGATVTCRRDGGKLVQRSTRDDGSQVSVFRVAEDGETLHVAVRITSRHLPDTIAYELTYRRAR